jgi:hypothetical protein
VYTADSNVETREGKRLQYLEEEEEEEEEEEG